MINFDPDKRTLHIIAVAYQRPIQLRILCDCFIVQTDPRWVLYIMYDGPPPEDIKQVMDLYNSEKRIHFMCSSHRNGNYGHPNRRKALAKLSGFPDDFVLLTNDDNYYVPVFVEYMMQQATRTVGMVICNTVHSHFQYKVHESKPIENSIDMGAFWVRLPIAKAVGFNWDDFSADGKYAEECANACRCNGLEVVHVYKPLFVHN
jgi:hypothetical protein